MMIDYIFYSNVFSISLSCPIQQSFSFLFEGKMLPGRSCISILFHANPRSLNGRSLQVFADHNTLLDERSNSRRYNFALVVVVHIYFPIFKRSKAFIHCAICLLLVNVITVAMIFLQLFFIQGFAQRSRAYSRK